MLAKTPLGQRFYNWVRSQNPSKRYNWRNRCECVVGRFLMEEMGYPEKDIHPDIFGRSSDPIVDEAWLTFNTIAGDLYGGGTYEDWTFGKLRKRIEAEMPECVA